VVTVWRAPSAPTHRARPRRRHTELVEEPGWARDATHRDAALGRAADGGLLLGLSRPTRRVSLNSPATGRSGSILVDATPGGHVRGFVSDPDPSARARRQGSTSGARSAGVLCVCASRRRGLRLPQIVHSCRGRWDRRGELPAAPSRSPRWSASASRARRRPGRRGRATSSGDAGRRRGAIDRLEENVGAAPPERLVRQASTRPPSSRASSRLPDPRPRGSSRSASSAAAAVSAWTRRSSPWAARS